ncbi:hypothetical protein AMJ80_06135 [bacterium SM23_31]|nr:MAG: hypothetical protein AMJ80_06135 [bacterium SM23_31]
MLTVIIRSNEPFDKAVRRFETECKKAGIIRTVQQKMYYEKPSRKRYLNKQKHKNKRYPG